MRTITICLTVLSICGVAVAQTTKVPHVPDDVAAAARAKLAEHETRIAKLRISKDAAVQTYLPCAEYILGCLRIVLNQQAWEAAHAQPFISEARLKRIGEAGFVKNVKAYMAELDKLVPEIEAGRNPYVKHPGNTIIAYRSALDGRLLGMRVSVPSNYDPKKGYALRIANSSWGGASGGQMRPLYLRLGSGAGDTISAVISDRGECHYGNDIHEAESLEAIDALRKMFNIDATRIHKAGGSKDGYTSVSIAMHYPHLFRATVGTTANSLPDGTISSRNLPCFTPTREQMNAYLQAENMYSLPTAIVTGFDGDHTNSTLMGALFEKIGAPDKFIRVEPEGGHGTTRWTQAEVDKWVPKQKLNRWPKRVYVSTNSLRYHKFYWVEVDALSREGHFARMRVDALDGNRIEVEAHNVHRFSLVTLDRVLDVAKPVSVEINDKPLPPATPRDGRLSFVIRDGAWSLAAARHDAGLVKKHGLSGPIIDAWIRPAMHVIGTLGGPAETARLRDMMASETRFWRSEGCGFREADHPVKLDTQVTPDDIRDRHLILWGNNRTNAIIARINPKLPVRLDGHKVIVGERTYDTDDVALAMVYPNPLNPERYVLIHSGNTWLARANVWVSRMSEDKATKTVDYFKIGGGYPAMPDYLVFRQNRVGLGHFYKPSYRKLQVSVLEGGFFDGHWQLTDDDTFHWKNPVPQKNAPLKVLKVVKPTLPARVVKSVDEKIVPPKMTTTPGTLALGAAQDIDGLRYHFSAAHHGRYFYRDFGSVFTSPGKVVVLELRVTNLKKGKGFTHPPLKFDDMPKLLVDGNSIAPYPVTTEQTFPAVDEGESFRIVFLYAAEPKPGDVLKLVGVGPEKKLTLTVTGAQLKRADYNPNHYIEGAKW